MEYVRRPSVVVAFQLDEQNFHDTSMWPDWMKSALKKPHLERGSIRVTVDKKRVMRIEVYVNNYYSFIEGGFGECVCASPGDWIVMGENEDLAVFSNSLFEKHFDKVFRHKEK